ncbi:MAG: hypothetical protein E6Q88_02980 [Lysobacteraceae bacterium]|nr:MAG: hypothetical protein E6Q88_02980 [Xanthomonadaceae bacterium]
MTPMPYHGLFRLLTEPLPQNPAAEPELAALCEADSTLVDALAERERCLPNLLDFRAMHQRVLDPGEQAKRDLLHLKHESAAAVTEALPTSTVLLKGANIHRHYPSGIARFSGDIDVMVRDYADLAPLHAALQSLGYAPAGSGLWGFHSAKPETGLASLRYWRHDGEAQAVSVEVQVGGFPIDLWRCVRYDELCRGVMHLPGKPYLTLAPTAQLLLGLADFVGRLSPVSIRHLADASLVARAAGDQLDLDYLRARIRDLKLESGLHKMFDAARGKGLFERLPEALRALSQAPRHASAAAAEVASVDPVRVGPLRRGIATGLVAAARAAYRLRPNARWPIAWATRPRLVRYALDSGYRVYGIPMSFKSAPISRLQQTNDGLYLSSGSGIYALSLCGDCSAGNRKWLFDRLRRASAPSATRRNQDAP